MSSSDLTDKLLCSICLNIFEDPVTLRCGHSFCQVCIDQVLNAQDRSGVYSCPECRANFNERPALKRNITLHNVKERLLLSTKPTQKEVPWICCTYCICSLTPAVKSCLHCEVSLCDDHLRAHSTATKHVLTDPCTFLQNRKCSVHKNILEYYCIKDAACICVYCSAEEHRGHQVEKLDVASEKKKEKLRNVLLKLITKKEETEETVQNLEEHGRKVQETAAGEVKRVTALFTDIRRRLDDVEKRVLSEISRQEKKVSLSYVIQKLEIKKDKLVRKIKQIEKLCNMTDPLTILQEPDMCDPEEEEADEDIERHKTQDVDVAVITGMLHAGFSDIMLYLQTISSIKPIEMRSQPKSLPTLALPLQSTEYGVIDRTEGIGGEVIAAGKGWIYRQGPEDILLDLSTANNNILISDDLKTATFTQKKQNRPLRAERFQHHQVLSSSSFSSGRHFWDVEISGPVLWMVGMCYPSIDRKGDQSYLGDNEKSWCLSGGKVCNDHYLVIYDGEDIQLPHQISSDRFRICLDYEAGELSFFELCAPVKHLYTITKTFTEPLHAALGVYDGYIKILGVAGTTRNLQHRRN
ncbi:E3 ubiquitin/ISG15 ligase TRIM25-like [Bufo gargarizans]|uniref:E3 ubiquitin/ISG15 ligase TRIM25-like n=1 Tax=Bufo gargarizans TaxID=30331 RepID=UPI001CF5E552|nr:E3 ubiquitin/ISG15 ligase TRIM25-like [Bufo gargarizans]